MTRAPGSREWKPRPEHVAAIKWARAATAFTDFLALPVGMGKASRCACDRPHSEDPHREPGSERCPELLAAREVVAGNHLGSKDRFGCLGVGTNDDRVRHDPQPPAGRNPLDLARRILAVAAGADQDRVGAAVDELQ